MLKLSQKKLSPGVSVSAARRKGNQDCVVSFMLIKSVPDMSASLSLVKYVEDADGIGWSGESNFY